VAFGFLSVVNLTREKHFRIVGPPTNNRRINPMKFANLLLIAALSGGLMAAPQETKAPDKMGQAPSKMGREMTVTGCLSKGAGDGYVLTDEKTGRTMAVMGPADLEKHAANHKVKLTGTSSSEGGKRVFNVSKIDHISETCEAPKK
jgi:hypothetical protein